MATLWSYRRPVCGLEGAGRETVRSDGTNASSARLGRQLADLVGDLVRLRIDHRSKRGDLLALAQPHDDHTLRRASHPLDVLGANADHGTAGRDQHHLVAVAHDARARELPLRLRQLHGLDADPAAPLRGVLVDARALAVAVVRHDQQVGVVLGDVDADDLVTRAQAHALHAGRVASHRARLALVEPGRHALARDEQDVVVARRLDDADELIVLA